jgi:Ran GTPase-activating protein (RanGAP) involved in mRNA processing and transport
MLKALRRKKEETELKKSVKRLKANDPSLTELNLTAKSIGDDGAKAIAEALKVNTVLTSLSLDDNSIGDDGAKAIAEGLKVNTVLTRLDLDNNSIGNDGAKAIAEALSRSILS